MADEEAGEEDSDEDEDSGKKKKKAKPKGEVGNSCAVVVLIVTFN
jgi:hypothetical protein